MEISDARYLAAALRPNLLSPSEISRGLDLCGSAESLFRAPPARLRLIGLSPNRAERTASAWRAIDPAAEALRLAESSVYSIDIASPEYPKLLRTIPDPPPILFYRGNLDALSAGHNLSVVGSRKMTAYGLSAVRTLVEPTVRRGVTVISGLAFGVDSAAHWSAVRSGAATAAVLASGPDRKSVGPKANVRLADEIIDGGGCLLSERPPGCEPDKRSFPQRNRLIAGLSEATLIIEATERSGSLVTARLALEYGREVLAVPGPITSPTSAGTNRLIADGASPALTSNDVIEALALETAAAKTSKPTLALDQDRQALLKCLSAGPKETDCVLAEIALSPARAIAMLADLEDAGFIGKTGNLLYLTENED